MEKNNVGELTGGLILRYIGVIYLFYSLEFLNYHLDKVWPGIIIIVAIGIIMKYVKAEKK